MPARKKSGRLTLRMDPAVHARIAKTAKALGMDINGLLNILIRMNLMGYEVMATYTSDPETATLLQRWREHNPTSDPTDFFNDFYLLERGHSCHFADGKQYRINDEGDGFIETPGANPQQFIGGKWYSLEELKDPTKETQLSPDVEYIGGKWYRMVRQQAPQESGEGNQLERNEP